MLGNHSRKVEYWIMTFKTFQNNVEMKHVSKENLLSVRVCFNGIMQTFFLTHTRILVTSPLGTDFPHPITTDHLLMVRAQGPGQARGSFRWCLSPCPRPTGSPSPPWGRSWPALPRGRRRRTSSWRSSRTRASVTTTTRRGGVGWWYSMADSFLWLSLIFFGVRST